MRHDAHYVETLTSFSGAAVGRMIPRRQDPPQSRPAAQDTGRLARSHRLDQGKGRARAVAGALHAARRHLSHHLRRAPLSRRHAPRGSREVPCIEKIADDAETLELALIENLQRKDLTAFEEADGLYRLAEQFAYTHEDIARKIAKARSSVTETLSLRNIPESIRRRCVERGVSPSPCCLQIARQPNEKKMAETLQRIAQGGLTRDEARRERRDEKAAGPRPQPFIFNFQPENEAFRAAHSVSQEQCLARGTDLHAARYSRLFGARHSRSCQRSRRRLGSGCGPK